ncbi:MAG: hypothetical protein KBI35_08970 [Ruminococcus sp.]|nr:hypothetical protein [Ruminococcus sp.]
MRRLKAAAAALLIAVSGVLTSCAAKREKNSSSEESSGLIIYTDAPTEEAEKNSKEDEAPPEETQPATKKNKKQKATEAPQEETEPTTKKGKKNKEKATEAPTEESWSSYDDQNYVEYHFRNEKLLDQHFDKHGAEFADDFGYKDAEEYEKGASDVINDPDALHKTEAEDGDYVYYIEETNEFVVLSKDGYIRTYFRPNAGKKYYDRQ